MFKLTMILFNFLAASLAFAQTPSFRHHPPVNPNLCYNIGTNEGGCLANLRYCFWDPADQRCEPKYDFGSVCRRYSDADSCTNDSECFWDDDDQRCEKVQTDLPSYLYEVCPGNRHCISGWGWLEPGQGRCSPYSPTWKGNGCSCQC